MTTANTDDTRSSDGRRAAGIELEDGSLLLYDPQEHRAWIQTDLPVDLDAYC